MNMPGIVYSCPLNTEKWICHRSSSPGDEESVFFRWNDMNLREAPDGWSGGGGGSAARRKDGGDDGGPDGGGWAVWAVATRDDGDGGPFGSVVYRAGRLAVGPGAREVRFDRAGRDTRRSID